LAIEEKSACVTSVDISPDIYNLLR